MKYTTLTALRNVTDAQLIDVALKMAEAHPITFERILMEVIIHRTMFTIPNTTQQVGFTEAEMHVLRSFGEGGKISTIRQIREYTKIGLKEAKDLAEMMFPEYCIRRDHF